MAEEQESKAWLHIKDCHGFVMINDETISAQQREKQKHATIEGLIDVVILPRADFEQLEEGARRGGVIFTRTRRIDLDSSEADS